MGMELRKHPRFEVLIPATFAGDLINGKGTVTNLSMGGCAVKGDGSVKVGAFLELRLQLPAPASPVTIDLAVVRWSIGTKFGVDILQLQPEEEKRLRRFLKAL